MFTLTLEDGSVITNTLWVDVEPDVRVVSIELKIASQFGRVVANHVLDQCDWYGFQRYDVVNQHGLLQSGVQLLGRLGDSVTVVDVDFGSGRTSVSMVPLQRCTYNPSLWRQGCQRE